jgi:hypothetical protein
MLGSPDNNSSTSAAGDRSLQYLYPKVLGQLRGWGKVSR